MAPSDLPRAFGQGRLTYRHVTRVDVISYTISLYPPAISSELFAATCAMVEIMQFGLEMSAAPSAILISRSLDEVYDALSR